MMILGNTGIVAFGADPKYKKSDLYAATNAEVFMDKSLPPTQRVKQGLLQPIYERERDNSSQGRVLVDNIIDVATSQYSADDSRINLPGNTLGGKLCSDINELTRNGEQWCHGGKICIPNTAGSIWYATSTILEDPNKAADLVYNHKKQVALFNRDELAI